MKESLFTLRYFLTRPTPDVSSALSFLDEELGPRPGETPPLSNPDNPTGDAFGPFKDLNPLLDFDDDGDVDEDDLKQLFPVSAYGKLSRWIPWARDAKTQRNRGAYLSNGGMPCGLTVHFTAGHPDESFENRSGQAADSPFSYLFIVQDGTLGQSNPLNQKGKHSGSEKAGFPNRADYYLVGCEVSCPGKMTEVNGKAKSWFPRMFDLKDCRIVEAKDNIKAGLYYKFSDEQEETLFQLCLWLKWNDPKGFSFDNVRSHDEIAPRRKNDVGGSLSATIVEFRAALEEAWKTLPKPV